jgi:hypothetical protein
MCSARLGSFPSTSAIRYSPKTLLLWSFSAVWSPTNQLLHQYCHQTFSTQFPLPTSSILLRVREASSLSVCLSVHMPAFIRTDPIAGFSRKVVLQIFTKNVSTHSKFGRYRTNTKNMLYESLSDCWIASVSGRSCDRPPRHRFFLVSLYLKANAEIVPNTPSCYCMLLMWPSQLNSHLCTCIITTATGRQPACS